MIDMTMTTYTNILTEHIALAGASDRTRKTGPTDAARDFTTSVLARRSSA